MAVKLKTKASIAANRAADNARIAAANTRAGKTASQQATADSSALASVNKVRNAQGLPEQTAIGVAAPGRTTGALSLNQSTNEVTDSAGNVLYKGSSLSDALAKQTELSSGSAPTVAGRPDLFAVAPGANQEVKPFYDTSTKTTVNPTVATPEQLAAQQAGTLDSFAKAQGLSYLDGATFKELQPYLNESDLIRGADGRIYLKQGLTADQVRARAATSVNGTTSGVNGTTAATNADVSVDTTAPISTETIDALMQEPVTEADFNTMLAEIQQEQDKLLTLLSPSDEELALKQQIVDIKDQISKTLVEESMGLNNVEDQPIAMQFITGQQASIQRSADAKLQNLARIEQNLLDNLGLAQEARQVQATVEQTKLGYLQTNLDTAFKVKQLIQQQEDSVFNRAMTLKTSAQNALTSILSSLQGIDETDMTPDQQKQLQDMAIAAGVPYSLVTEGLTATKNQLMAKSSSLDNAPSSYQEWSLAGGQAGTGLSYGEWLTRKDGSTTFSDAQWKAADFANRMTSADAIIQQMSQDGGILTQHSTADILYQQNLPTWLQESWYQNFKQAGDEFINSLLRRESGAAVSPQEFQNYMNEYFPMAGNDPTTIQQKADARKRAIQGLVAQSGGAYDALTGTSNTGSTSTFVPVSKSYSSVDALVQDNPGLSSAVEQLRSQSWTDDMILQAVEQNGGLGFNSVGADTKQGATVLNKLFSYDDGSKGGQCGHFVNVIAGTHMGDSYDSKMAYVNIPNTKPPSPGDIFVMPYKWTGHTGFVVGATKLADGSYNVTVKDSNWDLKEHVSTHVINSKKLSGYARIS